MSLCFSFSLVHLPILLVSLLTLLSANFVVFGISFVQREAMASEDTVPRSDDEAKKILVTEFERFVASTTLLMLNGVGKDLDIALAKDTTHVH